MAGIDAFTVLCLHCDGTDTSTTFTDSSQYTHTVTANGNAQLDTGISPVFGTASALFDGSGDYLSSADSADWAFGSGDFTIDLRVRFNSIGSERGFVSQYDVAGSQKSFRFEYNPFVAGLLIQLSADGSTHALDYRPAWSPATNTWYHVALVRSGSTVHAYIDGTEIGAGGSIGASSLFNSTHALQVGITDSASSLSPMDGWLDEVRVSKGIARWTSNFTPPAAAYSVDPGIDSNTVLMLHADGTDGSTTFTDSALTPHTITANGNAQIDTAQSVFGGASGLFDGTGDYLSTPDSADWAFGSGDFTVDFRVRFNSIVASYNVMISQYGVGDLGWRIFYYQPNGNLYFEYSTNGSGVIQVNKAWSPTTATWYHIAVVRTGNVCKLFVDGTQLGADAALTGTIWDATQSLYVGADKVDSALNGWLDEVRISKGVARWTANFAPPTAAYATAGGAVTSTKTGYATAGGVAAGTRTGGTLPTPAYPYVDLVPSYDLDNVFNRWTVTRDQGSPQTSEDTTSQGKYFLRAKQTQTLVSDDTAALAQAARKIAKFKDPQNRIETVTIQPLTDLTNTSQIAAGLGRDIGHVITIKETPPGFAAAQTKNYVIQSISGQINAGPMLSMTLTFGVWPA